jgi:outer membrane immunogenic protein
MFRSFVLGAIGAAALVTFAFPADMYRAEEQVSLKDSIPVPVNSWTGFYFGANGGYGWSNTGARSIHIFHSGGSPNPAGPYSYGLDESGAFGGGQVGFNYQLSRFVAGIEADLQRSDIKGHSHTSFASQLPNAAAYDYNPSKEADWFGTARLRLGWLLTPQTLIYATGGAAFGKVAYDARYIFTDPACCIGSFGLAKASETATGFVAGGGVEYALSPAWSLKAEYQYVDLGSQAVTGALFFSNGTPSGETFKTAYDTRLQTLRLGINYRVNTAYEPLK